MTKVLFIHTNCSWNKGSAAQVICTTKALRQIIPNVTFTLLSASAELESKICSKYDIRVVSYKTRNAGLPKKSKITKILLLIELIQYLMCAVLWTLLNKIGLNAKGITEHGALTEFANCDIVVDLGGDTFRDKMGYSLYNIIGILLAVFLKKKTVVFSQSIGPLNKKMWHLARFCLDRVDLIVIREDVTKNYLRKIGVISSVHLAPDIAFLLKPASSERLEEIITKENLKIDKNRPLIGISPCLTIERIKSDSNSSALFADIADYLVDKLDAQIIFIPHVAIPPKLGCLDDRSVSEKIYQLANNKNRIKLITGDYAPQELKGIIGLCDLFIGARMHSNIASTSMAVPTVAVGWNHKYEGIMRMLGQEKYVCEAETTNFDEMVEKIDDAWSSKDEIRKELESKLGKLEEQVLCSAMLVKRLVDLPKA